MLRVVGEPRRIDRAIRRLQGALKGVAARGVRLTWRGGELRTTIHWARDDSFWWAFEPRTKRQALFRSGQDRNHFDIVLLPPKAKVSESVD